MTISGATSAVAGINTAVFRQNVTANNISNLNTTAFKSSRVHQTEQVAGGRGVGAAPSATQRSTARGSFQLTSRPLDLALTGSGLFQLEGNDGGRVFTRSGNFSVDGKGQIVNANGLKLHPNIQVPGGAKNVSVNQTGQVTAVLQDTSNPVVIGQIQPSRFSNPAGLEAIGDNLFQETANSGPPVDMALGNAGGEIQGSFLEMSNVDLAEEFTQSIINSRTMEANVKSLRVQDQMTGTVIDLVR